MPAVEARVHATVVSETIDNPEDVFWIVYGETPYQETCIVMFQN
jgi:hypothetical protein